MISISTYNTWIVVLREQSLTHLGSGDCDEDVGCTGDVMATAAVVVVEAVGDCMGGRTVI